MFETEYLLNTAVMLTLVNSISGSSGGSPRAILQSDARTIAVNGFTSSGFINAACRAASCRAATSSFVGRPTFLRGSGCGCVGSIRSSGVGGAVAGAAGGRTPFVLRGIFTSELDRIPTPAASCRSIRRNCRFAAGLFQSLKTFLHGRMNVEVSNVVIDGFAVGCYFDFGLAGRTRHFLAFGHDSPPNKRRPAGLC